MKRVPLTHKDYPENFNKLAKYISKNWIDDKLPLEQSRQQLAVWLGYNSIFELEKSFVKSIPSLVDVDALIYSIDEKIKTSFKETYQNKDFGYMYINGKWEQYKNEKLRKTPFYLIEALDKSKINNFLGTYDKVAKRYPLFIQDYRFGGYYGLFAPYADAISTIEGTIGLDKSMQLHGFLHEYECFPFGSGQNHISVITMIQDRVNKYFDEEGNWKIEIFEPNEYLEEDETPQPMLYNDVWNILLEWCKDLDKWYVIDDKKRENHWLIESLDKAIKELQDNDYKKVPKVPLKESSQEYGKYFNIDNKIEGFENIKLLDIENKTNEEIQDEIYKNLEELAATAKTPNKTYVMDEAYNFVSKKNKLPYILDESGSIPNTELIKARDSYLKSSLNLHKVDLRSDTGFRDINNESIKDSERLYKDGKNYRVELKPKSNEYYMYDEEDLNIIINLKDIDTRDYEITPRGMYRFAQSI